MIPSDPEQVGTNNYARLSRTKRIHNEAEFNAYLKSSGLEDSFFKFLNNNQTPYDDIEDSPDDISTQSYPQSDDDSLLSETLGDTPYDYQEFTIT